MNHQLLKGHSRLLILSALKRRPMHGYGLSEYLKDKMADQFKFGVGMLYPLLHGLEKQRLIIGTWEETETAKKRVYRITKKGESELARQKAEWKAMSSMVWNVVKHSAV